MVGEAEVVAILLVMFTGARIRPGHPASLINRHAAATGLLGVAGFWILNRAFAAPDGSARELRIHPLPHPSPLNATWYKRFPDLLRARLRTLGVKKGALRI